MTTLKILLPMILLAAPLSRIMWDFEIIEVKNKGINYILHNFITLFFFVDQALLLQRFSGIPFLKGILLSWAFYELFFDYGLNFIRKKPVFTYFGDFNDEKNLSFIEKYVYRILNWKVIMAVKVGFFILVLWYVG